MTEWNGILKSQACLLLDLSHIYVDGWRCVHFLERTQPQRNSIMTLLHPKRQNPGTTRVPALAILSLGLLSHCGQGEEGFGNGNLLHFPSGYLSGRTWRMLRRGSDSNSNTTSPHQATQHQQHVSRRIVSKDDDDDCEEDEHEMGAEDLEADKDALGSDLQHNPQRQFKQEDYIDKKTLVANQTQPQAESHNNSPVKKNALGVGTYRDAHNTTDTSSKDQKADEDMKNNDSDTPTGNSTSQSTNQTLEENSQAAVLRHEDPLPERDVVGDSIFPFQQAQQQLQEQNDNVFGTRRHGNG